MNVVRIKDGINNKKNLMFYDMDIHNYYQLLRDEFLCIYFNEPVPVRVRLMESIYYLSEDKNQNLSNRTIAELHGKLLELLKGKRLIILFNNFERLTRKAMQAYQNLNREDNIHFVCSFSQYFKPEIYAFFKTFDLVNREDYEENLGRKEVNITYSLYAIVSIVCFLIYLKAATSLAMASLLIGGTWFALIIFRTLLYVGGKS